MECCLAASSPVVAPQHQRTEATFAQCLALTLETASVTNAVDEQWDHF